MASTGESKRADWLQKWQSSGHPPVRAETMPSTSTSGPHHASRTSWATAASAGTDCGHPRQGPSSARESCRRSSSSATDAAASREPGDGHEPEPTREEAKLVARPAKPARRRSPTRAAVAPIRLPARGDSERVAGSAGHPFTVRLAEEAPLPSAKRPLGSHEHDLEGVEGLEAPAGAEHDALEGGVDQVDGDGRLLGQAAVEAPEHAAAAHQVDALDDEVLGQLGRGLAEALHHRVDDGAHLLVDGGAHLVGRQDHRLGQAGHQVAAPHLGLDRVVHRVGASRWPA